MSVLRIRGVELGGGSVKIAVPLVGRTREALLEAAGALTDVPADLVEWRADCFEGLFDEAARGETLRALREALGGRPLLFTLRTAREGGMAAPDAAQYADVLLSAARSGCADLIDVELSAGEAAVRPLIDGVHAAGALVVGSRHDFDATPPESDMVARQREAQELGADVPKLAVMARSDADTLSLLSASITFRTRWADRPFITIAMGPHGVLSRIACALSGSCLSFGTAGASSAPGQLPAAELRALLDAAAPGK